MMTSSVNGLVNNQYSLDEYNGILRVVTTTETTYELSDNKKGDWFSKPSNEITVTNASLYCIKLATGEIVATVEDFAPQGESVQSARFDGAFAYVCTAEVVKLTDPVFFFDLTDLNNITYKDTGSIEGYSHSLVNFKDGYLLGIGMGDREDTFKIEIYEEGEATVRSVDVYERKNTYFSEDYKSYYIDRENGLIGFGICEYDETHKEYTYYTFLLFEGSELLEISNVALDGYPDHMRAFYDDGYLYMFGYEDFSVKALLAD